MERTAAARTDRLARDHPEADSCLVEGNWYAWKPDPADPFSGEMAHGRTEDELLAKLAAVT